MTEVISQVYGGERITSVNPGAGGSQTIIPSSQPSSSSETFCDGKLWCEECGQSLEQECTKHGFYSIIRDKTIPSRAKLTTPHQLTVRRLELRAGNNHVYGTFAKKIIQKRTRFGPFEGGLTDQWKHQREDRLTLKLFQDREQWCYLDCHNENSCNWMIYVRPADKPEHQNMVAFQYRGKIYFVSTKAVAIEEELRVWYAKDYAAQMGVHLLTRPETPLPRSPPSPFTESNLHIDEEFLTPPSKKNNKMSPEKVKKDMISTTKVTKKDEQSDNLRTLANIALQPPPSTSYVGMQNMQLAADSTPVAPSTSMMAQGTMIDPQIVTSVNSQGLSGNFSVPQSVSGVISVSQSLVSVHEAMPEASILANSGTVGPTHTNISLQPPVVSPNNLALPQGNVLGNIPVPQNAVAQAQVGVSVYSPSVLTGIVSVTQGTLSPPQGAVQLPPDSSTVYQSLQSAKIDDTGLMTIEEAALDSNTATLNVEILTEETESVINKGSLQGGMNQFGEKGDRESHEHAELTIDESNSIILAVESDQGADNGTSDTDDAEVAEDVDASSKTCNYCGQSFPIPLYPSHDCPKQKKAGLRKRSVINKRNGKSKVDKAKRTTKLKYGQIRRRRGSLTLALNKMTTKSEPTESQGNRQNEEEGSAAVVYSDVALQGDSVVDGENDSQKYQDIRKIKGSRKRKSGVVRKKVAPPYFECDRCEMVFSSQDKLQVHSYSHTGEKPFLCPHEGCGKSFVTKFKLKRHVTTHGEGQIFSCAYCDKTFRRKDHLKNHLKVHDPNKILYTCDICHKEYASVFAFKTHIAFHRAEQGELRCYVCAQVLPTKEDLLHHLKVHSGARSVKDPNSKKQRCRFCDKMFFTAKDVRRHEVVHTKERAHMCHLCPERFGRKDHLVRHIRLTHGKDIQGPLDIDNPALSILTPAVKLANESKKSAKKRQRGASMKKKMKSLTSVESGLTAESHNPPSLPSLQSQPTVILPETRVENLNQAETEGAKADYVLLEPKGPANYVQIQSSYAASQSLEGGPVSEAPVLQQITTVPNPTTQASDVQTYLELQPSEYFQFILSQNSLTQPKNQQMVNQATAEQTVDQTQVLVPQTSLSKGRSQRKPRRQRTKAKAKPAEGVEEPQAMQPEATQQLSSQPSGVITLPNVQNIFENPSALSALLGSTSFSLDNISFSGLTTIKPKTPTKQAQVQGQIVNTSAESQVILNTNQGQLNNTSGPVFPESATPKNSQPSAVLEGGNLPLTFFSVNPGSLGMTDQLQLYQFVTPEDQSTHQAVSQITEKPPAVMVSQQQQINQTQPVLPGYSTPVPNTQGEGTYPHVIVSHDSEAVRLFFPEEQKTVL